MKPKNTEPPKVKYTHEYWDAAGSWPIGWRSQNDGKGDAASKATRKDASLPIMVRPEFGPDTDIQTILRRHGAVPEPTRIPRYEETDTDLDLDRALAQIRRAEDSFYKLPKKHREKYGTPAKFWEAYKNDRIKDDPPEAPKPEQPPKTPETTPAKSVEPLADVKKTDK